MAGVLTIMTATLTIPKVITGSIDKVVELDTSSELTVQSAIQEALKHIPEESRKKFIDSQGNPREFLNCYLNGMNVQHKTGMTTVVKANDQLNVIPAIAGGCL